MASPKGVEVTMERMVRKWIYFEIELIGFAQDFFFLFYLFFILFFILGRRTAPRIFKFFISYLSMAN